MAKSKLKVGPVRHLAARVTPAVVIARSLGYTDRVASGYRFIDHTADLAIALAAPTEEGLLATGARAIVAVLTGDAPAPDPSGAALATRSVSLDALDGEDRLVQWLNEVLVLAVANGFLVRSADIALRPDGLDATVRGEPDARSRVVTELKSVTYHDLALTGGPGGWRARVVIDV